MRFVFGIVLIVLGLVMLFKPIVIWKIQSSLLVKNGEPTRFYYIIASKTRGNRKNVFNPFPRRLQMSISGSFPGGSKGVVCPKGEK